MDKIGDNEVMGSLPYINSARRLDLDCRASRGHSGLASWTRLTKTIIPIHTIRRKDEELEGTQSFRPRMEKLLC